MAPPSELAESIYISYYPQPSTVQRRGSTLPYSYTTVPDTVGPNSLPKQTDDTNSKFASTRSSRSRRSRSADTLQQSSRKPQIAC